MGNWRTRAPRRLYRQRNPWTASSYDSELPSVSLPDNVPPWEKKFCYVIGSVPWHKVVNTKKFMTFHTTVFNWDDSAVEETFHSAKERFWSAINGFDCKSPPPDPDIYIDEIDWDSQIDPELINELDREFFAPADNGEDLGKNKKMRNSAAKQADDVNHWEDSNARVNGVSESRENDNPWEVKASQANGIVKSDGWGCVEMSWDNWGGSCNKDWGWNRDDWNNPVDNHNSRPQISNRATDTRWPYDGGGRQWGPYNTKSKDFAFRRRGGHRGGPNENSNYQRDGPGYYLSGHRSSRFEGFENRTGEPWTTRGNNRKRVSFE